MTAASAPLLSVRDLDVMYLGLTDEQNVKACSDIDLEIHRGEILGIAGESASGKSTLLTAITRLQNPPAVTPKGEVVLYDDKHPDGIDLVQADDRQLRAFRWSDISIVMQSAMACLNPVTRLVSQFADTMRAHEPRISRAEIRERTAELLEMVGIAPGAMDRFAHELSGGMRQRALIALALACNPDLIVMDEPTTAVDVVMQRQILTHILRLQNEFGFAVIFVTHDLSLLLEMADRIAIMYAGRIVEIGPARTIADDPQHPYTQGLRNSFPSLHEPRRVRHGIPGSPPDLRMLPSGCAFRPRCSEAIARCATERPELSDLAVSRGACHVRAEERARDAGLATTGAQR